MSLSDALYHYRCYGMTIASAFRFPELDPARTPGRDLVIARAPWIGNPDEDAPAAPSFEYGRPYFPFFRVAQIDMRGTTEIRVAPHPAAPEEVLGLPVFGPVMATLLHYRGYLVLHGSALLIDGRLTVLVGDRGAGKSTTAGYLVSRGAPLFNDDLVAIRASGLTNPFATAGYPTIKISEEAHRLFGEFGARTLPTGDYPYPKIRVRLDRPEIAETAPISRICLLRRGEAARYERVNESEALSILMRYAYMFKFGEAPMREGRGRALFLDCAALARSAEIGVLWTPPSLERLGEIEDALARKPSS